MRGPSESAEAELASRLAAGAGWLAGWLAGWMAMERREELNLAVARLLLVRAGWPADLVWGEKN